MQMELSSNPETIETPFKLRLIALILLNKIKRLLRTIEALQLSR